MSLIRLQGDAGSMERRTPEPGGFSQSTVHLPHHGHGVDQDPALHRSVGHRSHHPVAPLHLHLLQERRAAAAASLAVAEEGDATRHHRLQSAGERVRLEEEGRLVSPQPPQHQHRSGRVGERPSHISGSESSGAVRHRQLRQQKEAVVTAQFHRPHPRPGPQERQRRRRRGKWQRLWSGTSRQRSCRLLNAAI